MKKILALSIISLALCTHAALAQEREMGFSFWNGLSAEVVSVHYSPQENCDVYRCGEWGPDQLRDRSMVAKGTSGLRVQLVGSQEEDADMPCIWDLKVGFVPASGNEQEAVFRSIDFCTPNFSDLTLIRDRTGVVALQRFSDQRGAQSFRAYSAE